jgi:hypothetical protein
VPHLHDDRRHKNAFGGLLNTRRHYTHSWIHETLVDLHIRRRFTRACSRSWTAPPPATARAADDASMVKNVMLASADQVAIDAVSAR